MTDSSGVILPKATEVYVAPLLQIETADVSAGIKACDRWLRGISDDFITIERLKMVASSLPVVANIMAAVDLVLDIKDMVEHGQHGRNPDVFDYLNLGLDLIGIVPVPPGTAQFRMGMRPVMKLVRQKVVQSGKALGEASLQVMQTALLQALIDSLSEQFAGKIQSFVDGVTKELNSVLKTCAEYIEKFLIGFAHLFEEVAGEKPISAAHNVRAAERHASQIAAGFAAHDASKTFSSLGHLFVDFVKIEAKGVINAGTRAAKVLDLKYREPLLKMAKALRAMVPVVKEKILALGGVDAGKIGWLINLIQVAIEKKRDILRKQKVHSTGIKEQGATKVHRQEGEGQKETVRHTEPAKHPGPNDKKVHCPRPSPPIATKHSVGFALGDERLNHQDFSLPGAISLDWTRTYRSFFDANDKHGDLGARWITAYTTRIDVQVDKFVYHDAAGRSLDYPALEPGDVHEDQGEGLTLLRLDEQWLTLTRGHALLETYERRGSAFRLAFCRDRAGNQVTLDYDDAHRLRRLIAPQAIVAFRYDSRDRIVEAVHFDAEGGRVGTLASYAYSEDGDLVAATDQFGNRREYAYRRHLLTRYTDRTGRGMNLEWDGSDSRAKCIHEFADDGSDDTRLQWHPDFRKVSVTDALGNVTQHYYDLHGYTFRIIHPDESEEWLYRDAHHNLLQHVHPDGGTERMTYDARGRLVRHARLDGSTVEMTYDEQDNVIQIVDPQGNIWTRSYDSAGNVVEEVDPLGHSTRYTYGAHGLPTEVIDAKGGAKVISYNETGQVTSYTDCSGKTTNWAYDLSGRVVEATDAAGGKTIYRYGDNGALSEIESAAGVERFQFDAEGRLLTHVDTMQRATRYSYDSGGRIGSRTDALGHSLSYSYDRLGRLVRITDQNDAAYQFKYDPMGRVLETIGFDAILTRYAYDSEDGRLSAIEEGGQSTRVAFDPAGRLICRSSGGVEERYAYDAIGRIVDAQNEHSRVQHFFDAAGNLVREHHAYDLFGVRCSYVWHHEYNEIGVRIRSVRPDGHVIDWLTYGAGHVHGLTLDGQERLAIERDDLHRETQRVLPNKVVQRTTYDSAGRMRAQTIQRQQAPAPLAERLYRYDAAGQLTNIEDSRKGLTDYRYDPVGRLIESTGPGGIEHFAFDPASNVLDTKTGAQARTPAPASPVRPESTLPVGIPRVLGNLLRNYAGIHFSYDDRGNLVEKRSAEVIQRFEWDPFNRLTSARSERAANVTDARYYYDAFGRRIARDVNGKSTLFGWDGNTLAYESDEERSTHLVYEANTYIPLAQYVGPPIVGISTPVTSERDRYAPEEDPLRCIPKPQSDVRFFHYHCDQIGTPYLLTDELGDVVWEASYKAWGQAREIIARVSKVGGITPRNPVRFQGQQADDETGLVYNRHRYYDPDLGRFVSKDPIGLAGGVNPYQYAPNAIGWIDPLGWAGGNVLALPAPTNSEPWMPNTPLTSMPTPAGGLTVQMAMSPGQTRPGGWATTDNITSVDYVRNNLAVTPQFKPEISHVQTFHIPEGVQLQHGTVGPQEYECALYPGGGSQVQILNYADRAKLVPIGQPRPIK
ncbi:RHS repeat-associated core domain-containing protein [Burkholderia stagnalis]|uniref:RHS repeat-associated core domain-containing protein n=1 Tax=Burkholderia stagnalis TaxID=1503054 RepID=UPI0007547807|nr:RHS repeat-associated core domain-containing protein [Burkholderia stagnalis]KVN60019.1 sugar-binding protein [Burkholderia stagnalis]